MSKIDETFQDVTGQILSLGSEYENKNRGVKRLQIPSITFSHDFKDGFPALSLKQLYFKSVVAELLWFLRGDNDIESLKKYGVSIWDKDAYNWYIKHLPAGQEAMSLEEFSAQGKGSVGQNYSRQWRDYNGKTDQIKSLVNEMTKDVFSSRLLVNAWNPSELSETALPPCHFYFQIVGDINEQGETGFWLTFGMRSWDFFLGASFNIASYALLAKIFEAVTGIKAFGIIAQGNCVHFYDNQYEGAKELLTRDVTKHPDCDVEIPPFFYQEGATPFEKLESFLSQVEPKDFKLVNYTYDPAIKVDMLAPKEV